MTIGIRPFHRLYRLIYSVCERKQNFGKHQFENVAEDCYFRIEDSWYFCCRDAFNAAEKPALC